MRFAGLLLALFVMLQGSASAHEIRPVFLDIRETMAGHYEATWKRPVFNAYPLAVAPTFDPSCHVEAAGNRVETGSFTVERFSLHCPNGLAGTRITLEGLTVIMVDGLVRVKFASGELATRLVKPNDPVFDIPTLSGPLDVGSTYLVLGVEHILFGYDHLLFVFALVLFVRDWRRLLLTATAFTVAHSITLSLAALGVLHVPIPPVEALIALSILLLAAQAYGAADRPGLAAGLRPASMAFGFGLLHGLGFASALSEIGLPQHEIPLALLMFNIGVELGQIAFIAVLLAAGWLLLRFGQGRERLVYRAAAGAIGVMAAFWTIERIAGFYA